MTEAMPKDLLQQRIAEWYSGVSIDLTGELLEARRQAIEAMARTLNVESACAVVAYAHGQNAYGDSLLDWITKHGKAFDPEFEPKAVGREPKVMTACAVAHLFATDPTCDAAITHGLLVYSAAFRGYRPAARGQNLVGLARLGLASNTERAYELPSAPRTSAVEKTNATFKELADPPIVGGPESGLSEWLKALKASADTLAARHDSLARSTSRALNTSQQDLDQIAWLLDEYCELGERAWVEMKDPAPIVAGAELAAITRAPNVQQSQVFLRSTLLKAGRDPQHTVKPMTAIQKAAPLLDVWPAGHGHQLLPLCAALDAWREKGEGASGWRESAKSKRRGGDLIDKTEAEMADQAYREVLIARSIERARN